MRILVAGVGNIFLGDDAFGVETVQALARERLPEQVRVVDFGIRSYDLAYALSDGYDVVILADATQRGQPPGTVYLIEPDCNDTSESEPAGNAHGMNPAAALQMARSLGGCAERVYMVGCEPAVLETDELGLSARVQAAVPQAVRRIQALLEELLHEPVEKEVKQ